MRLDAIDTLTVDSLRASLSDPAARRRGRARPNANATVNRHLTALRRALRWALERNLLGKLPVFRKLPEGIGRTRTVSHAEEERIVEQLHRLGRHEAADIVIVALDTGMRRSEIMALTPQHIAGDYVRVWQTKNGRPRSVPMTGRVKAILTDRLPWAITDSGLQKAWEEMRASLFLKGDPEFVFHILRHTCATRLTEAGVTLQGVKEYLGHSAVVTTVRYAHVSNSLLLEAARLLELKGGQSS